MPQFVIPETKKALPSRGAFSSPQIWKEEKSQRDSQLWGNTEGLWIIENKIYDLRQFKNHPGGSHWIEYTKGHDITEHFKTHHLDQPKARSVLKKYYVKQAKEKRPSRFTFQSNGLFQKIKSRLIAEYKMKDLQNSQHSAKNGHLLFLTFFILFYLSAINQSYLLGIFCGILIYALVGVGHNFIHMKPNYYKYFYLLTGFNHREWQVMHCISHHIYTNTELDFELQILEPFVFYYQISPKNNVLSWIFLQVLQAFGIPINIITKLIIVPLTQRKMPNPFFIVCLIQIPLLFVLTDDLSFSIKLFLVIHATFSFLFTKLTFIWHRTSEHWTEGNIEVRDFAEHQLNTSYWRYQKSFSGLSSYLFFAGFNYHAIHHLFPTIDNHYHPIAHKIMEEQAEKIGIKPFPLKNLLSTLLQTQRNVLDRKLWSAKRQ